IRDWPTAKSQMSIISCTSPSPSAMILPDSSVTSCPSSDFNSRKAFPSWRTVSPRTGPGVTRHFSNASCARATVRSYSASVAVRTRAKSLPSIGENFSMTGPLPDQSPLKTPGFSAPIPSLFRTDCIRHRLALRVEQVHRFVDDRGRDVERRAKADRMVAGFQDEQPAIEETFPKLFARLRIGQIERDEKTATPDRGHDRMLALQSPERFEKVIADHARVLDEVLLLDDSQEMRRANHVRVIPPPG